MPRGKASKRYTPEFKKLVVETMRAERLSHVEDARQFKVSCDKLVASWERIYLEEAPKALQLSSVADQIK